MKLKVLIVVVFVLTIAGVFYFSNKIQSQQVKPVTESAENISIEITPSPTSVSTKKPSATPKIIYATQIPTLQPLPTPQPTIYQAPTQSKVPVYVSTFTSTYYCLPDKVNEIVNADNAVKAIQYSFSMCQSAANIDVDVCDLHCYNTSQEVELCRIECSSIFQTALDNCVSQYSSWDAKESLANKIGSFCP